MRAGDFGESNHKSMEEQERDWYSVSFEFESYLGSCFFGHFLNVPEMPPLVLAFILIFETLHAQIVSSLDNNQVLEVPDRTLPLRTARGWAWVVISRQILSSTIQPCLEVERVDCCWRVYNLRWELIS